MGICNPCTCVQQRRKFHLTVGGDNIHNFSRAVFEGDTNNTAKIVLVRICIHRGKLTLLV